MNFTSELCINIYSVILLIIILIHTVKQTEKDSVQYKLYKMILKTTVLMLIFDAFSRLGGITIPIYSAINHFSNFMMFMLYLVLPSLWLLYVHYQVFYDMKKIRQLLYPLALINAVNVVFVVLSQFFGWIYYIDSKNIYHRGPLFLVPASFTVVMVISALILVIIHRKFIEESYFFSLVFFMALPLACGVLQIFFSEIQFVLNGVALSLLIIFVNIQNRSMDIDYLTGAYNRKKLDTYMKEKISASNENKTFSAILIDLDNFKFINDSFGHNMGDYALETCVMLLKSCTKANDMIARFGGDEFCAVLDVSNNVDLEKIVCRIDDNIKNYNEHSNKCYTLGFSMGYAVYDWRSNMKVEEFQKYIDKLMYQNKRANKRIHKTELTL